MMNVIIVSKFLRTPKKIAFHEPRTMVATAFALLAVLAAVFALGFALRGADASGRNEIRQLQARLQAQDAELKAAREEAQREINAIASRVGELQAQANRLNALGVRLTRDGKLSDGEFDFGKTPGMGGAEAVTDVKQKDLLGDLEALQVQFDESGRQLSVLESMLFNRDLELSSKPSRLPAKGYITSGFGTRSDPFNGGRAHHLGIDFDANTGDPVSAAAGGVVTYSGVKRGYGNVIEVDHGNGYTTLYGHNSRLLVRVGDVVRAGQTIAKAGSTGRSTGPHVHFEVHVDGRPVNPKPFLEKVHG